MAKMEWRVSKDGKTVTAGGQTYSISAFANQFTNIRGEFFTGKNALEAGKSGSAEPSGKKVVTPKVDSSPEKAKSRAEKKRYKKSIAKMNQALQSRKQGGITESGAKKNVNPVYRNIGTPMGGMGFPNTLNQ